ncbi:MAG: response regulator [Chloroflexota bacterium]
MMRVLLADDDADVRSALRLFLESVPGLKVVAETAQAWDMVSMAREVQPDLVLLDWELPSISDGLALQAIRDSSPHCTIVAMSSRREAQPCALALGASDFICKVDPPEDLLAVLERAVAPSPTCAPGDGGLDGGLYRCRTDRRRATPVEREPGTAQQRCACG